MEFSKAKISSQVYSNKTDINILEDDELHNSIIEYHLLKTGYLSYATIVDMIKNFIYINKMSPYSYEGVYYIHNKYSSIVIGIYEESEVKKYHREKIINKIINQ